MVAEFRGRRQSREQNLRGKSRGKSNKYANVECHHCKKKDHIKKFCRKFKKEQENRGKAVKKDDNSDDDEANLLGEFNVLLNDDTVNLTTHETSWVIESGASIHATSRREFFSSYIPRDYGFVKMGNGNRTRVAGEGDVCLEIENGKRLVLKNVKHIPDIRLNLISTDKLDDVGFKNTFHNSQ